MISLISLLAAGVTLLSLNNPTGVYSTGDTVRVYANDKLVHEEVCHSGPYNPRFDYDDTCIGWVVNPSEYRQALPCPDDFDAFWKSQIKAMRALPMNYVLREEPAKGRWDDAKFVCYSVSIDCVDNTPVRGYIAMPRDAASKSLPIVTYAHGAGVAGGWCRAHAATAVECAAWGNGAIAIDLNAFGMLNDQPQSYYDDLDKGALANYAVKASSCKEDYFFKGMYLRMVRALDFLCTFPQWDGKRVLCFGSSQGGLQSVVLAGLDKRVTHIVALVPAGCNPYGSLTPGGQDSWPYNFQNFGKEKGSAILPYFDCCNMLARTKADVWFEIGLLDTTCKCQAIYSALNANTKSVKHVLTSPWRYHNEPDARYHKAWEDTIFKARMEHITAVLQ